MVQNAVESGSSVVETAFLYNHWSKFGKWHKSKERIEAEYLPMHSYNLNKKWTLEEEFNNHMMRFHQVTVSSVIISINYILTFQAGLTVNVVRFKEEKEDDDPEPLRMEHFYFPLGLWLGGLLLSAIFLLTEIIIHRRRKSKTDIAMLPLEEPSVSQTSQESENLEEMVLNKWRAVGLSDTEGPEVDSGVSENI